jgi:hypothetical protein
MLVEEEAGQERQGQEATGRRPASGLGTGCWQRTPAFLSNNEAREWVRECAE